MIVTQGLFIDSTWVSIGIISIAGFQGVMLGLTKHRAEKYRLFSALCVLAIIFHIGLFLYYTADNIDQINLAVRLQAMPVYLFMPLIVWFTAIYTGYKINNTYFNLFVCFNFVLLVAVITNVFNWRFVTVDQLTTITLPWSETLSVAKGKPGIINLIFFRLPFFLTMFWCLKVSLSYYNAQRCWQRSQLAICYVLFLLSFTWGLLIDFNLVNGIYVIHFCYLTFIVVIILDLIRELKINSASLQVSNRNLELQLARRIELETTVRALSLASASANTINFFETILKTANQLFEANYSLLAIRMASETTFIESSPESGNVKFDQVNVPKFQIAQRAIDSIQSSTIICDNLDRNEKLHIDDKNRFESMALLTLDDDSRSLGKLLVLKRQALKDSAVDRDIITLLTSIIVNELKRHDYEQKLRTLAYSDSLTGLANRAKLQIELSSKLNQCKEGKQFGSVLLIDLDHFKNINDGLSYEVGDKVLQKVAERLKQLLGQQDIIARLGGDEFAILLASTFPTEASSVEHAFSCAKKLMKLFESPVQVEQRRLNLGLSIGVASFPDPTSDIDVLRRADMALYEAKFRGRNTIKKYQKSLFTKTNTELAIAEGLQAAIKNNEFELVYQPQVNQKKVCVAAEALLRWNNKSLGHVSPVDFIPVAEQCGQIYAMGQWVLHQTCMTIKELLQSNPNLSIRIAINVSTWQFSRQDYISDLMNTLQQYSVHPKYITLELTESGIFFDLNEAIKKFKTLQALGFHISLDDFGTGYSSLSHLKELPLNEIKIDRSFIKDIEVKSNELLVKSIISIAHTLSLTTVSEGVEEMGQFDKLNSLNCELYQGYLFYKPIPKEKFKAEILKQ